MRRGARLRGRLVLTACDGSSDAAIYQLIDVEYLATHGGNNINSNRRSYVRYADITISRESTEREHHAKNNFNLNCMFS